MYLCKVNVTHSDIFNKPIKFRDRANSSNWSVDKLTKEEETAYKKKMGHHQ